MGRQDSAGSNKQLGTFSWQQILQRHMTSLTLEKTKHRDIGMGEGRGPPPGDEGRLRQHVDVSVC